MLDGHLLMLMEAVHNIPPCVPQSLNVGGLGVVQSFDLLEELGAGQLEPLIESKETQQELYLVLSLSVAACIILSRHRNMKINKRIKRGWFFINLSIKYLKIKIII